MAVLPYDPKRGLQPGQTAPTVPSAVPEIPTGVPPVENNLRFNERYAGLYRNLDRQQVEIANQKNQALSGLQSGYNRSNDEAGRMQKLAKERLQTQMSDQGILRSGVTVGAQGSQNEEFLRYMDDLARQHTSGVQEVENQTASAMNQLGFQREQLMQEQAREEQQARLEEALARARMEQNQPRPTATGQLVREAFAQHGLDPAGPGETAEQRISRIAYELENGRTSESLLTSLRGIQERMMAEKNVPGLRTMVQNLFGQYNVPLQASTTAESPAARLDRIAMELANGRTLESLHSSLRQLAGR